MTRFRFALTALTCAALFTTTAAAPLAGAPDTHIQNVENGLLGPVAIAGRPNPGASLAERMRFYKVPGLSIAVINNGVIEWARGYGVLDAQSKAPVEIDSQFQAASISKPVFAMAALSLVEKGALRLDEDVNDRLASWKLPENAYTQVQKVTLRRLLNHTAGTSVSGFGGYGEGQPVPTVLQVLDGVAPANSLPVRVESVPGEQMRYSGGGMIVAQLLASQVSGRAFAPFMHDTVLAPLGMAHSTYEPMLPGPARRNLASAHTPDGAPIKGKWHSYPELAAAGLWTTPSDLALFAIDLQQSRAGLSHKVLSKEMATQMLSRSPASPFGLGIQVAGPGKVAAFSHSGGNEGFRCQLFAYAETGQGVVIMTNGNRGMELIGELMRSVAKEYGWSDYQVTEKVLAQVDAKTLASYAGRYHVGGMAVEVRSEGTRLLVKTAQLGPEALEAYPETASQFFLLDSPTMLSFVKGDDGAVVLEVMHRGQKAKATRVQ